MEQEDPKLKQERRLMLALMGTSIGFATLSALLVAKDLVPRASQSPDRLPPQVGDILVHATGHTQGQPLDPASLPLGGPFLLAYPMDPKTGWCAAGTPRAPSWCSAWTQGAWPRRWPGMRRGTWWSTRQSAPTWGAS